MASSSCTPLRAREVRSSGPCWAKELWSHEQPASAAGTQAEEDGGAAQAGAAGEAARVARGGLARSRSGRRGGGGARCELHCAHRVWGRLAHRVGCGAHPTLEVFGVKGFL